MFLRIVQFRIDICLDLKREDLQSTRAADMPEASSLFFQCTSSELKVPYTRRLRAELDGPTPSPLPPAYWVVSREVFAPYLTKYQLPWLINSPQNELIVSFLCLFDVQIELQI